MLEIRSVVPNIARKPFGTTPDGTLVEAITLSGGGIDATILTFGATLQSVIVPDRSGNRADVTIGYDDLAGYLFRTNYFGSTVGRCANRIAKGWFALDGETYRLPLNNGVNSLHGGTDGFDRKLWEVISVERGSEARVTLRLVSPDGDQGYPGALTVVAIYALGNCGKLSITYRATTTSPTIVNITNHAYWNLSGDNVRNATAMRLTIPGQAYLPVDHGLIPTGELRDVAGTPFDFRIPSVIGDRLAQGHDDQLGIGHGFDHNWVIARERAAQPRLVARLDDPVSGRTLDVFSTEPGLQFYSGNFLDGTISGKRGQIYHAGDAICLEPQAFPDTPNQPAFGSARLDPGQLYEHRIVLRFSLLADEIAKAAA